MGRARTAASHATARPGACLGHHGTLRRRPGCGGKTHVAAHELGAAAYAIRAAWAAAVGTSAGGRRRCRWRRLELREWDRARRSAVAQRALLVRVRLLTRLAPVSRKSGCHSRIRECDLLPDHARAHRPATVRGTLRQRVVGWLASRTDRQAVGSPAAPWVARGDGDVRVRGGWSPGCSGGAADHRHLAVHALRDGDVVLEDLPTVRVGAAILADT